MEDIITHSQPCQNPLLLGEGVMLQSPFAFRVSILTDSVEPVPLQMLLHSLPNAMFVCTVSVVNHI
ncbi:hypothetical protein CWRG_00141 [Chthonomonas calidirosea]|nr:hypothetical protein CWRG_00141 [Chthonomonas calidirosea]